MRSKLLAGGLLACSLVLVLAPVQILAKDRNCNFWIIGAGVGPQGIPLPGDAPRPHWAIGLGTYLGLYCGEGEVQTDSAVFNPDGTVTGEFGSAVPFVFTGEHGDQLACYYGRTDFGAQVPGTFVLTPHPDLGPTVYSAEWLAEFVPYDPDCTGKFKGAKGSWIMYAYSEPFDVTATDPVAYAWYGEGSIKLKKGR